MCASRHAVGSGAAVGGTVGVCVGPVAVADGVHVALLVPPGVAVARVPVGLGDSVPVDVGGRDEVPVGVARVPVGVAGVRVPVGVAAVCVPVGVAGVHVPVAVAGARVPLGPGVNVLVTSFGVSVGAGVAVGG